MPTALLRLWGSADEWNCNFPYLPLWSSAILLPKPQPGFFENVSSEKGHIMRPSCSLLEAPERKDYWPYGKLAGSRRRRISWIETQQQTTWTQTDGPFYNTRAIVPPSAPEDMRRNGALGHGLLSSTGAGWRTEGTLTLNLQELGASWSAERVTFPPGEILLRLSLGKSRPRKMGLKEGWRGDRRITGEEVESRRRESSSDTQCKPSWSNLNIYHLN